MTRSPTEIDIDDVMSRGGYVIIGQAFAPAWHGSLGGVDLGPALRLDTMVGWHLAPGRDGRLEAAYGGQRIWELALALTAGGTAFCVWLAATGRRR